MPATVNLDDQITSIYCEKAMEQKEYRLAAIMHTDIVGFSRLMEQDEVATLELLKHHNQIVTGSVNDNGGRVIKTLGDTVLCEFPNTVSAVKSGVEIQTKFANYNASGPKMEVYLRIGIHLGDTHFTEDDALGEGVVIATRLQSLATPGRVCISQDVYNLVSNKLELSTEPLGEVQLKNVSREIVAYEVVVSGGPGPGASSMAPGKKSGIKAALRDNLDQPEYSAFNELKALVLEEIKKAGRRISVDDVRDRLPNRGEGVEAALESLVEKGFLTRGSQPAGPRPPGLRTAPQPRTYHRTLDREWGREIRDEIRASVRGATGHGPTGWDRALAEGGQIDSSGRDQLVEDYKDRAHSVAEKEKAGLRGHLISYAAVNAGLFFLWLTVAGAGFPWFLIVALGWGIGLVSHFAGVREKVRETRELDQWPNLTREQLRIYRKLVKARSNWSGHLVSNIATSAFLLILNLIVSPGFLWAAFPVGFMAIGVFSHLPAYKAKERRLLKRLRDAGARIAHLLRRPTGEPEPEPVVQVALSAIGLQAESLRQRIQSQIAALGKNSPVGDELEPVLDNYVQQIKLLDQKNQELDVIMRGIPLSELDRDLANLQRQRGETQNQKVIAEYDKSIEQIEKQQSSFAEIENQQEILNLRLTSSLNQLKQMEIDLVRMKSVSSDDEIASIQMLKDQSDELSHYLDDLYEGYKELE